MNNTEHLWKMYEDSIWKEEYLRNQSENSEVRYFNAVERCTQNDITNGILRRIEAIEGKEETWKKSFDISCNIKRVEVTTEALSEEGKSMENPIRLTLSPLTNNAYVAKMKPQGSGLVAIEDVTEDFLRCIVRYCSDKVEFIVEDMRFRATCEKIE